MYAGSDGSVKDRYGAHVYGFTSGDEEGTIWEGSTITPGLGADRSYFRSEHGGIGDLLVLYVIHIYMGSEDTSGYRLDIWIGNIDMIWQGRKAKWEVN